MFGPEVSISQSLPFLLYSSHARLILLIESGGRHNPLEKISPIFRRNFQHYVVPQYQRTHRYLAPILSTKNTVLAQQFTIDKLEAPYSWRHITKNETY